MSSLNRSMVLVLSSDNTNLLHECVRYYKTIDINNMLKKSTVNLKSVLKITEIPKVSLTKFFCEVGNNNIIHYNDDINELRFVIHDVNGNDAVNNESYDQFSHTIEIYVNDEPGFKPNDLTACDLKAVISNVNQINAIIEDVVLDIQMFHYYNFENKFNNIQYKKEFSKLKREFCIMKKKRIKCGYWLNDDANYYALSSFCRNDDYSMDYETYCDLWNEFYNYLLSKKYNLFSQETKTIVDRILNEHKQGKQISAKKLYRLVEPLEEGEYILIRLNRKPKKKKVMKEINALLNSSKVKVGTIHVVPIKYKYVYQKYSKLLSMFYFVKPKPKQ